MMTTFCITFYEFYLSTLWATLLTVKQYIIYACVYCTRRIWLPFLLHLDLCSIHRHTPQPQASRDTQVRSDPHPCSLPLAVTFTHVQKGHIPSNNIGMYSLLCFVIMASYDLFGPVWNAFDASKSIIRACGRGLGPQNRDFFGPCEIASNGQAGATVFAGLKKVKMLWICPHQKHYVQQRCINQRSI